MPNPASDAGRTARPNATSASSVVDVPPPRFFDAAATSTEHLREMPGDPRWLPGATVVYGAGEPPERNLAWRALIDVHGSQLPNHQTAAAGQPSQARRLLDRTTPPTTASLISALVARNGSPARVIALPLAEDFSSVDKAYRVLSGSQPVIWHRAGVGARPAGSYPLEHLVGAPPERRPVSNGVAILRLLPERDAQGTLPSVDSPIFRFESDEHGRVRQDRIRVLQLGPHSYRGGVHFDDDGFSRWSWQPYRPPDGRVRLAPGNSYKAVQLTLSQDRSLRVNDLLAALDPAVGAAHVVMPGTDDVALQRLMFAPVLLPGEIVDYPDGALPADSGGNPLWPAVNRAMDLLRALNAATGQLARAFVRQSEVAEARVVVDYYTPAAWRDVRGELVRDPPPLSLADSDHFFSTPLPTLQERVVASDSAYLQARAQVDSAARALIGHIHDDSTLRAFEDFINTGGCAHAQWVLQFLPNASRELSHHNAASTGSFRIQMLDGTMGRISGSPFHPIFLALQAAAAAEHDAADASAGGAAPNQDSAHRAQIGLPGDQGDSANPPASSPINAGAIKARLENLGGAINLFVERGRTALELSESWIRATDAEVARLGETELVQWLRSACPRTAQLYLTDAPAYLDRMRALRRNQPAGSDLVPALERHIERLSDQQTLRDAIHSRELANEGPRDWVRSAEGVATAVSRVVSALTALDLFVNARTFAYQHSFAERVAAGGNIASDFNSLVTDGVQAARAHLAQQLIDYGEETSSEVAAETVHDAFTLGNDLETICIPFAAAAAAASVWTAYEQTDREGETQTATSAQLAALSSVMALGAAIFPPPFDVAFTLAATFLTVSNTVLSYLWNFYYSAEGQRVEAVKAKAARATRFAREPILYFPRIEIEGLAVHAHGPGPISLELRNSQRQWLVLVHKYEGSAPEEGQATPWVPLASRSRLPSGFDVASEQEIPHGYAAVFPAMNFELERTADGTLSVRLPDDLVPVPQWAWGPGDNAAARFAILREAAFYTRPFAVIAQIFNTGPNISDADAALQIYTNHFGGEDGAAELSGVSRIYDATFSADVRSGGVLTALTLRTP